MQVRASPSVGSRADSIFRALGDPTRRALFERLMTSEAAVVELTALMSVSQPAVSQHLAVLRESELVTMRQEGRNRYYSARPEGLAPLFDWLAHYQKFWPKKLVGLAATLDKMRGRGDRR
jgi:DNA-binding transcriptional ArsR family regulator